MPATSRRTPAGAAIVGASPAVTTVASPSTTHTPFPVGVTANPTAVVGNVVTAASADAAAAAPPLAGDSAAAPAMATAAIGIAHRRPARAARTVVKGTHASPAGLTVPPQSSGSVRAASP